MEVRDGKAVCPWCWYARDREDICGVYCTGGFTNEDGTCGHFLDYEKEKERRETRPMAFKTNVVKTDWQVETQVKGDFHRKRYLVKAESEDAAKLRVPEDEEIVSVTRLDGGGDGA